MPRRTWKAPPANILDLHLTTYPCPTSCAAHQRISELFGVASSDIDNEIRTNNTRVPLAKQMVNGFKMRELIARMLLLFGKAVSENKLASYPQTYAAFSSNPSRLMGFVFGAIADFCFNMEYARRITDARWVYCNKANEPRVYYPYLGVCPYCILKVPRPTDAVVGVSTNIGEEEKESSARYFGNKIESHHVGRIGERVLVYIIDLLTKACHRDAISLIVFDDQHDVDSVFFFGGVGVLAQIKASPLILLPIMAKLHSPLTDGVNTEAGLPELRKGHSFAGFAASEQDLKLYFSTDDSYLTIGNRHGEHWPYEPLLSNLDEASVLKIIENWVSIYLSFEIPKRQRQNDDIKRAYLTSGWGAPIDDNKTKAGLARSDNMMKGTYASLKYGAYYVQECQRKALKTVLISNIDPAHQYADYLEKLEDIRWGHQRDFRSETAKEGENIYSISSDKLTYLFDSVFTFNRQIINDQILAEAWDLSKFIERLSCGELATFLSKWRDAHGA